jgi:hypothetical protein
VPTSGSVPARSICDAARDARARNSPAAAGLEAQCRASTPPEAGTGKVLGRVPTSGSVPARSICDAARDARARNSPAAAGLEAQCRASRTQPGAPEPAKAPGTPDQPVKKSTSNICYPPGAKEYAQIANFTPYKTVSECLASGGRLALSEAGGPGTEPQRKGPPKPQSLPPPPGTPRAPVDTRVR